MNAAPTILAFDTAAGACSAALWRSGRVVAHRFTPMTRGHAEALMPMIVQVMSEASAGFADLDRIAVTVGPGGFTGLRVGLAAARGLALAAGVEVLGITTFDAVAESVSPSERSGRSVLVLLDTKRSDVYAQLFDAGLLALSAAACLPLEDLRPLLQRGPLLIVGDAVAGLRDRLSGMEGDLAFAAVAGVPDAACVARLASRILEGSGHPGAALPPEPLYLRAPDVHAPARASTG